MAILNPFCGLRPSADKVSQVACRPYDVLDSEEARIEAGDNSLSFYHVIKPEIDWPHGTDPYSSLIYQTGKKNFKKLVKSGVFTKDPAPYFYIYQLTMNGRTQTGIVGCASVDDYMNDKIKKHELTRPVKENDRKNHVRVSEINAEPVFFAYRDDPTIDFITDRITREKPEYDFITADGIQHTLWLVNDNHTIFQITEQFKKIPYLYVADGHHRTAAAALVGKELREANKNHTGTEEYNFFMAVVFPASQLKILDYNRLVKDLNGLSHENFLAKISESFNVVKLGGKEEFAPLEKHNFSMYLDGIWYSLTAKTGTFPKEHPIESLDVSILQKNLFEPILGILDQRTDKRIDFVGGIRGLGELSRRVDSGEMKVAFALYPVSINDLFKVADTGNIMPPKTTWFEPKLRSGLVVHSLR
ncbi:MAG: hypothetical protein A3G23_05030 [Bacteroidetes bacterium RIFCSPLOWO2_12_FULL_37_12]|nr:MAG: hypothetical protein A3G23_05030 [Bacteroidetes bacterium RIFCSPLOWO2_12_FULL_37_12]